MDDAQFDRLIRACGQATSRRGLLGLLPLLGALLFRGRGDSWLVVVAKLSLLVGLVVVTVAVLGDVWLRFW